MSNVFRKRGFKAHKQEEDRREKERESRIGKLWRYFLKDGEEDVPLRFLTEEPILFYEHSLSVGGKYTNVTCEGDDCPECAKGDKPSYKGAWLVVDGREVEVDEKKDGRATGKKRIITDQVRLYVRGSTDIAKLDRLSRKFGLMSRPWFATKTGSGTSTSYELDRGEPDELTEKQITNLLAKVPEKMRDHYDGSDESLMDIVEANIFDDFVLGDEEDDPKPKTKPKDKTSRYRDEDEDDEDYDDDDDDVDSGVQSVDDEEEEEDERPRRRKTGGRSKPSSTLRKKPTRETSKPARKKTGSVFRRR